MDTDNHEARRYRNRGRFRREKRQQSRQRQKRHHSRWKEDGRRIKRRPTAVKQKKKPQDAQEAQDKEVKQFPLLRLLCVLWFLLSTLEEQRRKRCWHYLGVTRKQDG